MSETIEDKRVRDFLSEIDRCSADHSDGELTSLRAENDRLTAELAEAKKLYSESEDECTAQVLETQKYWQAKMASLNRAAGQGEEKETTELSDNDKRWNSVLRAHELMKEK